MEINRNKGKMALFGYDFEFWRIISRTPLQQQKIPHIFKYLTQPISFALLYDYILYTVMTIL